jgi:archaeosine synthase alpha-subunit
MSFELTIPTPEVTGGGTVVHRSSAAVAVVHAPFADGALDELRKDPPGLVVLGNAAALWAEGEAFVEAIGAIRSHLGAGPLLWSPRVALPHRVPLLAYLGVDLVDTTEGLLRAARGTFLDPVLGEIDAAASRAERACPCPACAADPPGSLTEHARAVYERALRETRAALRGERLRELVEARLAAEPALAEQLRYADRHLAPLLEAFAPVTGGTVRPYVLAEAHRRPEMARFRTRLLERYRPPPSKSVLLVVPCSRTKPYRLSPSHRRLARAVADLAGLERLHIVSVSSPIGLVPQELEDLPPARHYDIPVTGDWREEERTSVLEGLGHLLGAGAYRAVFLHLDPKEYAFLSEARHQDLPFTWTAPDGRTGSPDSLGRLRQELGTALAELPRVPGGPLAVVREELFEVASVQFGRAAAERLLAPPLRLQGRPWFQRLTSNGTDLASLRSERGLFHLTIAGARRMGEGLPRIEVDAAVRLDGDLFVPGIVSADPAIRAGDEVALYRSGELVAAGEAALPGPLLEALGRGLAVHVRHRAHAPTDTAKSLERS